MVPAIIMGLAAVSSAIITGVAKKRQMDRTKAEARSLADISRKDELNATAQSNKLAQNDINLGNKQLSFDKQMFDKTSAFTRGQEQYTEKKSNRQNIVNSVKNLMQPSDDSWLYKGKVLGRFA